MKALTLAAALAFGTFLTAPSQAQNTMETAPLDLTFERVFASPDLDGPAPRKVKLSPDGRYLTLLRNRADDRERYDLWAYDREAGELISAGAKLAYPIREGVPIMLPEEARQLD